ncbi:MAG: condensation domain-containing protein [Alphaproteobacteria bacterium]
MTRGNPDSSPSGPRPGAGAETLGRLIEIRAAQSPDAAALTAPDREPLTYAGLARQLGAARAALRGLGIRKQDRVALVLENGPEAAGAFLSVAACCASAPLNRDYVRDEFEFYLSDLSPRAVIVDGGAPVWVGTMAKRRGIAVLHLMPCARAGEFMLALSTEGGAASAAESEAASGGDVALLLHTSGTTSRPKLVPLTHRNLLASARAVAKTLALGPGDVCLNIMPLFHIHGLVGALLAALHGGGSVVCTPGFNALEFFPWLDRFRPTWYTAVPTMHQAILSRAGEFAQSAAQARLRFVRSSSAALAPQVMEGIERLFRAPVIEAYGMTEAAHQMASNPLPPGARKPGTVGLPAGPEIAILGEDADVLAAGERGEVAIRGESVTAGYVGNEAANRHAFVDGWFRTGDEGVFDGDGYLTITGRLKEIIIRGGEKVAPREVDEVLLAHPEVAEAVTFAVPDPALGEEAGAAVVLRPGSSATASDIKAFAAKKLAYFKVPRHLVIVDALPKGATGKIQRIGLAEKLGLEAVRREDHDETPPRTETETALVELWRQVLRRPRIGTGARFLDLGGDSILAAQLVARVHTRLGVDLTLVDVFDTPTIAEMAVRIEEKRARAAASSWPPLRARKDTGPPPISFSQEWWLGLERLAPPSAASNRPSALRLQGPLDAPSLSRALAEVLRRHESLRTAFPPDREKPGGRVQEISPPAAFGLDCDDLAGSPSPLDAAKAAIMAETAKPFDIESGPLYRARLLRLGPDHHVLSFVVHHAVFDGWSMAVFTRELAQIYGAFAQGHASPLPEPALQYADFAAWQRDAVSGARREALMKFWRERLADVRLPELPADHARLKPPGLRGGTAHRLIPQPAWKAARALGHGEGATLYMVCLTAFHALLGRLAETQDVATGCLVTGRSPAESESLIGLFFNAVVMRTDLSGDPTVRELLGRVRRGALGALAHQDMPIGALVDALKIAPGPGESPIALVPVLFQMRNFPKAEDEAAGVTFREFKTETGMARFDLTFDVAETDGGLALTLDYNRDLFDAGTSAALLADFAAMLDALCARPEARLSSLPAPALAGRKRGGP